VDRDRILLLAELATDKAEEAASHIGGKLAGPGRRVIDELVDHHVRVRPDGQRRLIDEQDLGLACRLSGDTLVVDDVLSDQQLARRGTRCDAGGLGVDGTADADALLGDRRARQPQAEHQGGERSSTQRIPDDPHC
jgi:hypothetical protein